MVVVTLASALLAQRTGAGIRVAVVDSGVHPAHPHVGRVGEAAWVPDGFTDGVDRLGHGTAVAAAIRDIAPGTELLVAKVFDRSLASSGDLLARAMHWAAGRGARVVNLSLGTANTLHERLLLDAVTQCAGSNAIVVSARESGGTRWLPGALPGVVPVLADASLEREEIRVTDAGDAIVAAPFPRPIPGVPRERNLSGVSFAVANASGFIARLLEARPELRTAGDVLSALASA